MRLFTLLLLLYLSVTCNKSLCQFLKLDKARENIYTAKTDAERLNYLEAIGKFRNSLPADTIYRYTQWIKELAVQLKDDKRLALAEYYLVSGDLVQGKTDSVIYKIENNSLFKDIKRKDTLLYYKIQFLKANAYNRVNNRAAALDLQLQLLNETEKEGNTYSQLFALNYIGATYLNINKVEEAKQNWLQALEIIDRKKNPAYDEIEAYVLSNLALYYSNSYAAKRTKQVNDSFFFAINKTIELAEKNENRGLLSSALAIRGEFYGQLQQFENGEKDIKAGLEIRKKIGDPLYILNDFISLSNFYLNQKEYKKCIETAREGVTFATLNGIRGEQLQLMAITSTVFKNTGDYKQYSKTLEQLIAATDSSNKINAAEKIAEIQTKYEVQKKEALIAKQKLDLFQQNIFLFGSGIATVLLLSFLGYRFKKYRQRQKIHSELAVKDAEEKERKRIAAELHDNLGVQANAILHNSTLLSQQNDNTANTVTNLQETAKEMLLNLRETLWAMKTADVTAMDLWLRIINFMKQMGRHYTTINFKIEGEVPKNMVIPSNKALNIVLVLQETVNNAVKHAAADTITAISNNRSADWVILIKDNGAGFDADAAKEKKDSYGLKNMQERATSGNFNYTITTKPGSGTETKIILPL
jgi:signal transduction histidine kinase